MLPHLPLPEILIKKPHPQAPASVAKQAQKAIRIEALVARPPRLTEQAERAFRMWGFSPRWRSARAEEPAPWRSKCRRRIPRCVKPGG